MSTINPEDYKGYRGVALNTLQKFKTPIWSDVEILPSSVRISTSHQYGVM